MLTIYGIPNCDKCRAARKWFETNRIDFRFHDLRADALPATLLQGWLQKSGSEVLVNRRSTTWRSLSQEQRDDPDEADIMQLLTENPTLIKRPVADDGTVVVVGYDEAAWTASFTDKQ